jgi:hypothetical protein
VTTIDWEQPRPVPELLALLREHHSNVEVSLLLTNGASINGHVCAVDGRAGQLVVQEHAHGSQGPTQTHLALSSIVAVTISNPASLAQRVADWAPVGTLALRRLLSESSVALGVTISVSSSASDEERAAFGALVQQLPDVVQSIQADDTGREAWKQIETLEVVSGPAPAVTRDGDVLRCVTSLDPKQDPGSEGWLSRFERAL